MLFVGVAASSSFKDVQDVSLNPGETAVVGGKEFTYVKPTPSSSPRPTAGWSGSSSAPSCGSRAG